MSGPIFADRVKETTTTTGTGTLTLAGAATGYQSFAVVGDGNTCYYCETDGTNWEVILGSYTVSGTTLSKTTILSSSNSGSAVTWGAGSKDVFLVTPASMFPGVQRIGKVVCAGGETTITFSGIPQNCTDLLLVITGKDTQAGTSAPNIHLQMNGDSTSGNYGTSQYVIGSGTTAAAGTNASSSVGGVIGGLPQASGTVANLSVLIPLYAQTSFQKVATSTNGLWYSSGQSGVQSFVWKSTAAITSLTLTAGGTGFAAGTTGVLYGMG